MWVAFAGIGVIFLIFIIPYIRILLKRISFLKKLFTVCKVNDVKFTKNHSLWFFRGNKKRQYSFSAETTDTLYRVKLFYVKRKSSTITFFDGGDIVVKKYYYFPGTIGAGGAGCSYSHKPINANNYDFGEPCADKKTVNVLLLNPICIDPRRGKDKEIFCDGDTFANITVYSASKFLSTLSA